VWFSLLKRIVFLCEYLGILAEETQMGRAVQVLAVMALSLVGTAFAAQEINGREAAGARPTYERSRAKTCVVMLKKYGDQAAIDRGAVVCGGAKAEHDAVIGGLETALAEDARPVSLSDLQARMQSGFDKRTAFCDLALARIPPDVSGQKGPVEEIVKGVAGPLVDAVKAIVLRAMDRHYQVDDKSDETIRLQLEDAKWPSFESVSSS
jgi:hypothetical protein